jgi:NADPH2:quinone reductase
MEAAINRKATEYSRYGSTVLKQLYVYGSLDTSPTEFVRNFGSAWSIGGWLVFPYLQKLDPAVTRRLKQRVADELKTTFASHYAKEISLAQMLDPAEVAVYNRRATGTKFLVNPARG